MNIFEEFDEYVAPELAKYFSKKEILEIKERIGFSYMSKRTELLRKHDLKVSCKERDQEATWEELVQKQKVSREERDEKRKEREQKAKMEKIFYETVQNHDLTFEASMAFLEKEYIERLKK
jgi:hypothetical protein